MNGGKGTRGQTKDRLASLVTGLLASGAGKEASYWGRSVL